MKTFKFSMCLIVGVIGLATLFILNEMGVLNMLQRWKLRMSEKQSDKTRDIRICGDCANAFENPNDSKNSRGILVCRETLMPVHRSRSVSYCNSYAIKGEDYGKETKEEKKGSKE